MPRTRLWKVVRSSRPILAASTCALETTSRSQTYGQQRGVPGTPTTFIRSLMTAMTAWDPLFVFDALIVPSFFAWHNVSLATLINTSSAYSMKRRNQIRAGFLFDEP